MSATHDIDISPLPEPRSNRPVTVAHRAEYALALALGTFFRLIGVDAASAIAGGFARFIGPMIGPIRHRARVNLKIAYPDMEEAEAGRIIRGVWENLGRTTAEFAHLDRFDPDARSPRVAIAGRDRLEAIAKSDRPAIFVSGHFGNWEVMSIALHAIGVKYGVIYRAANNPLIDGLIIRERARVMSRRQIPKGKRGGRDMIDTLKSGASLAMLVDQKLNTGGVASPFFGKPAMTANAAARLALKYCAPVIPIEIERLKGARFRVTAHPPIEFSPGGDIGADTQLLTDLINLEIEKIIRTRPEQWLWLHRRWGKEEYI
ncbi:MAG: lysophospholipid acyltransferase family protein [Parvularculaceae bacterium]|nr:lysophospholipid acyltransferase family protein [Parvularculaceae bacterium]